MDAHNVKGVEKEFFSYQGAFFTQVAKLPKNSFDLRLNLRVQDP